MEDVEREAPDALTDTAWSAALIVWAMRAADRIAVAERAEPHRPSTARTRPSAPVAMSTAVRLQPPARPVPNRSEPPVPLGGSAA